MTLLHRSPSWYPLCYCRDRSFPYLSARLARRLQLVAHIAVHTRSANTENRARCRFAVLRSAMADLHA